MGLVFCTVTFTVTLTLDKADDEDPDDCNRRR
jgi:hypothetical protein